MFVPFILSGDVTLGWMDGSTSLDFEHTLNHDMYGKEELLLSVNLSTLFIRTTIYLCQI
jgi:hypothetical protein